MVAGQQAGRFSLEARAPPLGGAGGRGCGEETSLPVIYGRVAVRTPPARSLAISAPPRAAFSQEEAAGSLPISLRGLAETWFAVRGLAPWLGLPPAARAPPLGLSARPPSVLPQACTATTKIPPLAGPSRVATDLRGAPATPP